MRHPHLHGGTLETSGDVPRSSLQTRTNKHNWGRLPLPFFSFLSPETSPQESDVDTPKFNGGKRLFRAGVIGVPLANVDEGHHSSLLLPNASRKAVAHTWYQFGCWHYTFINRSSLIYVVQMKSVSEPNSIDGKNVSWKNIMHKHLSKLPVILPLLEGEQMATEIVGRVHSSTDCLFAFINSVNLCRSCPDYG